MAGRKWDLELLKAWGVFGRFGGNVLYVKRGRNLLSLLNSRGLEGFPIIKRENCFSCGPDKEYVDVSPWKYCKNYDRALNECPISKGIGNYDCMESGIRCDDFIFTDYKTPTKTKMHAPQSDSEFLKSPPEHAYK